MYPDQFLLKKLGERIENNSLRCLTQVSGLIDFSSNDYLGIKTNALAQPFFTGRELHGSGGARTLTGNYTLIEEVEENLAQFHRAGAGLLFNSGFAANIGLLSSIPQRGDTILYDSLSHASLRDGIRLSHSEAFSFHHNDADDLEKKMKKAKGTVFVATESVFSMDGDLAPLVDIVAVCERYGAHLIVDEAHATGIIGEQGEGLVQHLGLEPKVFARVHTFGKALGCHGAIILGSDRLRSYLLNFARSFIFTTALPEAAVKAIQAAYRLFPRMQAERMHLRKLVAQFQKAALPFEKLSSPTPIQGLLVAGNKEVKTIATHLQQLGFDVRPILYPTVPKGKERLRINLHAFNSEEQVSALLKAIC